MSETAQEHVLVANTKSGAYRMFCLHCGEHYTPSLPINVDLMLSLMKTFGETHQRCEKRARTFTVEEIMKRFDRGSI